jgi:uncharacterized membrane protein YcaP (DUF421 family)
MLDGGSGLQVGILLDAGGLLMVWSDLLVPGIPLVEKIVRPLIVYAALLLLLRMFGRRQLSQLNPYDLVVLMMISNTVQNAIIGNDNSVTGGLLGAVTLLIFNTVVVRTLYKHDELDRAIEGDRTLLIADGKLMQPALDRERIRVFELETAAQKQGFETLAEVDKCLLEPGGGLVMFGRKPSLEDLRNDALLERLTEIRQLLQARGAG